MNIIGIFNGKIQFSTSVNKYQTNVIAKAVNFVNNFKMSLNDAIQKSMILDKLKSRMVSGEMVKFAYRKVDGSIRYAIGTLQADVVAANTIVNGTYHKPMGTFCYIDLESFGWRSFKEERLIEILN